MTTKASTKIRLVRCPKCRQLLAEMPDVSLYQCGGCGTVLEAKNRKQETSCNEPYLQEAYSVARSQQGNIEEEKEAGGSNDDSTRPPSLESSPDKDSLSCCDDSIKEHGEGSRASDGPSSVVQVTCSRREDMTPVKVLESLKQDDQLGQNSEGCYSKSRDDSGKWSGRGSNEIPSLGELTREVEVDIPDTLESEGWDDEDDFNDEIQNLPELEDEETVLPQDGGYRDENEHSYVPRENDDRSQISSMDQNGNFCGGISLDRLNSDSDDVAHDNNNLPQPDEQIAKVDDELNGLRAFGSLKEKNDNRSIHDLTISSQKSLTESLASFYLTCPDDEPLDHSPREVTRNYGRASSIDTLGSSALADFSSELNFKYGLMANYPPASSYYAYDGSESSYDGTDDQIREHVPLRNRQDTEYNSTKEMLINGEFLADSELERNYWAASSSHRAAAKGSQPDKSTEANGYVSGNSLKPKKRDFSRLRPASRDPVASHRGMSPSNYRYDLLPPRPDFNSSDIGSYSEADKMDLLRRVYELKDQLNRIQLPRVPARRRFPAGAMDGKFSSPLQCDHLLPDRDMYLGLNHRGAYHLRHDQGQGCAEGCRISRPAFSGEVVNYRHRLGCSCLHCHPQDWHYSAQLPCKKSCCAVHADNNFISTASSPQHYRSSELLLWGRETMKSGNQKHDEINRLLLKAKHHVGRKHVLPVARGAPFISCYHCFELLQLPADFLLFKRSYHQLRCNACRKILKYSLLEGAHLVRYLPDASAPPPSVADGYNDAARSRTLEPISNSSSCQRVEAVSYSDYGESFGRSCSTEGEASVLSSSVKQVGGNSYNRKMSSVSSCEPMENRKMKSISIENQSADGAKTVELAGPSSQKETSEIKEVIPLSNSPLHRLMGYSSPSQVMSK